MFVVDTVVELLLNMVAKTSEPSTDGRKYSTSRQNLLPLKVSQQ